MKPNHTLNGLIPRPVRIVPNDVRLPATALDRVHLDADTGAAGERLLAAFAFYGKNLTPPSVPTHRQASCWIEACSPKDGRSND